MDEGFLDGLPDEELCVSTLALLVEVPLIPWKRDVGFRLPHVHRRGAVETDRRCPIVMCSLADEDKRSYMRIPGEVRTLLDKDVHPG